jgi:hypothetical protein
LIPNTARERERLKERKKTQGACHVKMKAERKGLAMEDAIWEGDKKVLVDSQVSSARL